MRQLIWASLALAGSALSCTPPGSWTGLVEGHMLSVKSAIFGMGTPPLPLSPLNAKVAGAVVLSDSTDACADVTGSSLTGQKTYLVLGLVKPTADTVPPSTYLAINPQTLTNALDTTTILDVMVNGGTVSQLYVANSTCGSALDANTVMAIDGTVTVGAWDPKGSATGIYDLTMGNQNDPIRGAFNATVCPGLMPFLLANPNFMSVSDDPSTPPPACH